jgi:PAS domain S-box-containing protein
LRPARVLSAGPAAAFGTGLILLLLALRLHERPLLALPWVISVNDALIALALIVVAALCAQDTILRRNSASLPLGSASAVIATLWLAHFVVAPEVLPSQYALGAQTSVLLFHVAYMGSAVFLTLVLLFRPGLTQHPRRAVFIALVPPPALAAAGCLLAVAAAPALPPLIAGSRYTSLSTVIAAVGLLPVLVGLVLFASGRRGDERLAGGIRAALILLAFSTLAILTVRQRYDASFYMFQTLRSLAAFALLGSALALHRHSVLEERRRVHDLRLLHEAARALSSSLDVDQTLKRIAQGTLELFQMSGDRTRITIFEREGADLKVLSRIGPDDAFHEGPVRITTGEHPLLAGVIASGQAATWSVEDLERAGIPTAASLRQAGYEFVASAPIWSGGHLIGVLALASRDSYHFDEESLNLLKSLAYLAGLAMANARAYEALAKSESRFRTMFEDAGLAILVHDRRGRLVEVNPACCALLGYERHQLLERTVSELTHPEDRSNGAAMVAEVVAGTAKWWEERVVRKDGTTVWVEVTADLFPGEDGEPRVINMLLDLTERRRAEAATTESREKSRFLATMSHELRTPLASVIGFAQLLDANTLGNLNQAQQRHISNILESGRHLLSLVEEVLEFSRIEAGQTEISLKEFDLNLVVLRCLAEVSPIAEAKNVKLSRVLSGRPRVRANRLRLRQVVINLLSNAIKFTPPGGRVVVGTEQVGQRLCLSVSDTGLGIPLDQQERIFEEFAQVDSGRKREYGGAGLGLAVARGLAGLMDGSLTVCSQPGLGSLFTLSLPLAEPAPHASGPQEQSCQGLETVQDPLGRLAEGTGLDNAVAQELKRAELHGYPVSAAALVGVTASAVRAAARPGDLVLGLAGGKWLMVLPNADLEGARQILKVALARAPGGRGAVSSSEAVAAEAVVRSALESLEPTAARAGGRGRSRAAG